jgi:tripartite-type tricarboxylate transporter receptor subunit TctC
MRPLRPSLVFLWAFLLAVWAIAPVQAQSTDFPNRAITLVIPYTPGGATDRSFRALAQAAGKHFRHSVVVENKPGGSGAVAISNMLGKPPDGHTVTVIVPVLQRASYQSKFSFDTVKDLTPIIQVGGLQYGIVVHPDSPYKSLKDLLEAAKRQPGALSYMSAGLGSGGHIYMEEIAVAAGGLRFNHIPANGDAQAAMALLGKQIDFIAVTPGGWESNVQAGKLRLLATLGEQRMKKFADVPTVKELGYGVVHLTPLGLAGPKGVPASVVKILHEGFRKAMAEPDFVAAMEQMEHPILYLGPEDYAREWAATDVEERERVRKFILKSGAQ